MNRAALLAPVLALCAGVVQACGSVEFEPGPVVEADRLPDLRWRPVTGANAYLVEVTARVPEGPLIDRRIVRVESAQVGLPRLDDARPTKVVLSVAAQCGEARGAPAERMWLVLPSTRCPAVEQLAVASPSAASRTARWQVRPGQLVEVRAFDAETGVLKSSRQTTAWSEALPVGAGLVLAVRRLCGSVAGPFSYLFVD